MKLVTFLLRTGLLAGLGYLLWRQWNSESAGAAEWISTSPATPRSTSAQSIPETEDELRFSDAEEEGWPAEKDPFAGQDPLTAPLPEDI